MYKCLKKIKIVSTKSIRIYSLSYLKYSEAAEVKGVVSTLFGAEDSL